MRAERRCAFGRRRCELQNRVTVAGRVGVMRESRQIRSARGWVGERLERLAMELDLAGGRDRVLDGEPPELVPERDPGRLGREHP